MSTFVLVTLSPLPLAALPLVLADSRSAFLVLPLTMGLMDPQHMSRKKTCKSPARAFYQPSNPYIQEPLSLPPSAGTAVTYPCGSSFFMNSVQSHSQAVLDDVILRAVIALNLPVSCPEFFSLKHQLSQCLHSCQHCCSSIPRGQRPWHLTVSSSLTSSCPHES